MWTNDAYLSSSRSSRFPPQVKALRQDVNESRPNLGNRSGGIFRALGPKGLRPSGQAMSNLQADDFQKIPESW